METPDKNDATVLLRLPNDLKAMLMREANINGRRITAEINMRLKASLQATGIAPAGVPGVLPRTWVELAQRGKAHENESNETERDLLALFRGLAPDKQLALLALLK